MRPATISQKFSAPTTAAAVAAAAMPSTVVPSTVVAAAMVRAAAMMTNVVAAVMAVAAAITAMIMIHMAAPVAAMNATAPGDAAMPAVPSNTAAPTEASAPCEAALIPARALPAAAVPAIILAAVDERRFSDRRACSNMRAKQPVAYRSFRRSRQRQCGRSEEGDREYKFSEHAEYSFLNWEPTDQNSFYVPLRPPPPKHGQNERGMKTDYTLAATKRLSVIEARRCVEYE
jgi:hypothetical protein